MTAARFLGYASNPLSVWYLYSSSKELSALILEVNNTSDERRIYFLKPEQSRISEEPSSKPRYTGTWQKDFYVSVFNARAGSYSLAAYDPFFPYLTSTGRIDSTVTLSSPEEKAKLIARIYSTDTALDPLTMTLWQKTCFLALWWWVGLATFPRTIQQALIILFRRKLPWVFRPEPRGTTIARHASPTELFVENIFRCYLQELVSNFPGRLLRVRYIPAGLHGISEVILSSSSQLSPPDKMQDLELRVLTPIFYSRLVRYPCLLDGLLCEHESATISISDPDLLSTLDFTEGLFGVQSDHPLSEMLSYQFMHTLRRRPAPIVCLDEPKVTPLPMYPNRVVDFTKAQSLTGLDAFVIEHSGKEERNEYRARLWKLMLIEVLAFGWEEVLEFEVFVVKILVLWLVARIVFP